MMYRSFQRYLALVLLLCLLVPASAFAQKSFLWEVKSDRTTVYLFGSLHMADASFYPLSDAVEEAFAGSDYLGVEVNPLTGQSPQFQQMMLQKGLYPGSETLQTGVSEETFGQLSAFLQTNGMPIQMFMKMRPTMVALTLTMVQLQKFGVSPEYGLDLHFAKQATGQKPIIELESMEMQLDLLFDHLDQELFLKYTLQGFDNLESEFNQMVSAWKSGDAGALDALLLLPYDEQPELKPMMQKIYYDRNLTMTDRIKELLQQKETGFVVVGAGHLVGDKGIVQLLKNENYRVRQL